MSARRFVLAIALLAAPLPARETIGAFGRWAAFCDEPRKCFAISQPEESRGRPFLSVAIVGPGVRVSANIGRPVRTARLRIGTAQFALAAAGEGAVADPRTSRRIVAAMRDAERMTVIAVSSNGGAIRHHYLIAGAPSAIDAAAVAALR